MRFAWCWIVGWTSVLWWGAGCAGLSAPRDREASDGAMTPLLEQTAHAEDDPGQDPAGVLQLNAEEAVLKALAQNRELRVVRFEPAMRREQEAIERSVFDPVVSFVASERRARIVPGLDVEEMRRDEATSVATDLSMTTPLGTRWGLGAEVERTQRGTGEQSVARVGMTARQPLLRGAGRAVNVARLEQARLDTQLSVYEVRGVAEMLAAQVEAAYWSYVLALRRIELVEESLRLAERQAGEIQQRIRVGEVSPTEAAAAETEVAIRREARIDALSRKRIARARLVRLVEPARLRAGLVDLHVENELQALEEEAGTLAEHVEVALRYRPDLNQARLRVERGEWDVLRTANGVLPRLDVFLRLGKTGYAEAVGSAFSDLDGEGYEAVAGIDLAWSPVNREARASRRRATWSYEQAVESLQNMTDLVVEDIHIAHVEVERAHEQVKAKASTRALQEETLRAETAKFAAGKSTSLMVAQAQRGLLGARVAEAEAMVEHRRALTALYRLDGTLLQRRGIEAPGAGWTSLPQEGATLHEH